MCVNGRNQPHSEKAMFMLDLDGLIGVCQVGKDKNTSRWETELQRSEGRNGEISCHIPLFPLGHHNRIPQASWLMNSRYLIIMVLDAGSPRSRCLRGWVPARSSSAGQTGAFPCVFPWVRKLWGPFHKGRNPIQEGSAGPNHLPKARPPNAFKWE